MLTVLFTVAHLALAIHIRIARLLALVHFHLLPSSHNPTIWVTTTKNNPRAKKDQKSFVSKIYSVDFVMKLITN